MAPNRAIHHWWPGCNLPAHLGKTTRDVPLTNRPRGVHQASNFVRTKPTGFHVGSTYFRFKRRQSLHFSGSGSLRKFRSRSGRFPYQPHFVRTPYEVNGRKTALVINSDIRRLGPLSAKPRPGRFDAPGSASQGPAEFSADLNTGNTRNVGYSDKPAHSRFYEGFVKLGYAADSAAVAAIGERNVEDQLGCTACEW